MGGFLNIVNEDDEIIGVASREDIHRQGLRHREIHVIFITPKNEIIFQHRAKDKDTYPDLLDATVGGHVEIGQSYEEAVIKETEEETGLKLKISDLKFVGKVKREGRDETTGKINNVFNRRYLYIYSGKINDLKIEVGKGIGFEAWPLDKILNISDSDKNKFIPYILNLCQTELGEFINKQ